MERNEMIEIVIAKANINREEAIEVLEQFNWDVVDSIVYLERQGKVENNETTTIIEVKEEYQEKQENNKKREESYGGIGTIIGRIFKGMGKVIKKANENFFEIRKDNEKPMRISLIIAILLLIFLSVPTIILLVLGLFCGYRYSLSGSYMKYDGVNDVFEKASESADNIKRDFKEGYEK